MHTPEEALSFRLHLWEEFSHFHFDRVVVGDHSTEGIGFQHFGGKPRRVGKSRQIVNFAFCFEQGEAFEHRFMGGGNTGNSQLVIVRASTPPLTFRLQISQMEPNSKGCDIFLLFRHAAFVI